MNIIKISELKNTNREVLFDCGMISNRILLKEDKMNYTLTKTEIPKGDWRSWHYKNHLETCYCISGEGILYDINNKKEYSIISDTIYVLNNNDPHRFKALTDVVLICVFTPPLLGQEKHQKDGSYI